MKTFVMACGCRLPRESLVRRNNSLKCQTHRDSGIVVVERQCLDCWETIKMPSKRCKECQAKHAKNLKKELNKRYRENAANSDREESQSLLKKQLACEDFWDCKNRSKCLDEMTHKPWIKHLPCHNCERYVSMVAT